VHLMKLRVVFVPEAGVDEHRPYSADDERTHRHPNPVSIVRRRLSLPQRLRHDAEHRAAVEAEEAVAHGDQLEVSERKASDRARTRGSGLRARGSGLLEFDEDAVRTRGVNEGDQRSLGSAARLLVDEPGSARFQLPYRGYDVLDPQRDVMQPRASFLDVLGD